jgi:hypothetical protein
MRHSHAFVDPRTVRSGVYPAAQISDALLSALVAVALAERCACGATGTHSLCPLQPITPELSNAAL